MKFLLVDDSRTIRNIEKTVLKDIGTSFTEAEDGSKALIAIAQATSGFDMMLVDWNMPNMDGITLVRSVRQNDKRTPIIMVTTEAEKSRIIEAIKCGVNNYVIKPFTPESLQERVRQTLAKTKGTATAA